MKNFVSYFEIAGTSGVMLFSGKGVEIRALDPNISINIIDAFTILYCSKRVKQMLKDYVPDKSVHHSIVERISGNKSTTSFIKKQKANKNTYDSLIYDISEYAEYEPCYFSSIEHSRYFFNIDALYIAKKCAGSFWAGIWSFNRKSLLKYIQKYRKFRYVHHRDILECCIDFV